MFHTKFITHFEGSGAKKHIDTISCFSFFSKKTKNQEKKSRNYKITQNSFRNRLTKP